MSKIHLKVEYAHPPAKVWRALTEPKLIAQWLMENDFVPRVGHQFTLRTEPAPGFDGIVRCEVLELIEPRKLSFSWRGGPIDTIATFELEPTERGTRLRFTQTGFRGFKANLVRLILGSGHRKIYRRLLPGVLDRMDGVGREVDADDAHACDDHGLLWRSLMTVLSPILGPPGKRPR